ncbi:MAG: hypothetical protein SNJ58_05160 [Aggregatilineales bacterium]
MQRILALIGLSLVLGACSGLGGEPPIVATLPINPAQPTFDPTVLAQIHAEVTPNATSESTPIAVAPEEALGTVSGQVSNATAGAALPAELEIELHSVDRAFNDTVLRTKADADGKFIFQAVPIRADRSYFAAAVIDGRYFASDPVVGSPAAPALDLSFRIYERTADPSVVKVANVMTQVSPEEGALYVVQIIRFENTSDRIFSTDERIGEESYASVRVKLPDGALLLGFATDEQRFHVKDGLITDTLPVYPNTRHVVHFRYRLPYADGARITLALPYRAEGTVTLLVNPPSLEVVAKAGEQTLSLQTVQDMNGTPYSNYAIAVQASEISLDYTFSGTLTALGAGASVEVGDALRPLALALIAGGALMIGVGLILLVRSRKVPSSAGEPAQSQQERLIAALAALDEQYKRGSLAKAAYTRQRDALKAQLAKLMGGK